MTSRHAAVLLLCAGALAGCPRSGGKAGGGSGTPLPPAIPAELKAEAVPPATGHDPAAKSPIIDMMAEENARWYRVLAGHQMAPAHYIGYTIHERRSVVIEAEDGVLLADEDEDQRALDVEVRVGSKELDSRHPLKDPRLAAFTSLARLGTVPDGQDEKAIR